MPSPKHPAFAASMATVREADGGANTHEEESQAKHSKKARCRRPLCQAPL